MDAQNNSARQIIKDNHMSKKFWLAVAAGIIGIGLFALLRPLSFQTPSPQTTSSLAQAATANLASGSNTGLAPHKTEPRSGIYITPPTFVEAIAKLPAADQTFVNALNAKTYGLLQYFSKEELEWKLSRAFPTVDQVLKLRDSPRPPILSKEDLGAMDQSSLSSYLVQLYLKEKPEIFTENEYSLYKNTVGNALARKLDSPLAAFLEASTVDLASIGGGERLAKLSIEAALLGDGTLATEIMQRFGADPNVYAANKGIADSAGAVAVSFMNVANRQFTYCGANRYTGNPRTVEITARQMQLRPCK